MGERCDNVQDLLPELLNGTLHHEDTVDVLHHVRDCVPCKHELAFLAKTKQAAQTAWHHSPSPAFADALWSRLQEEQRQEEVYTSKNNGNRLRGTFSSLQQAVFPLAPAYKGVRYVYQLVASQFKHIFFNIIPHRT